MPRILHIINQLGLGGAEVMLIDILKYADKNKFDYHLLLPFCKSRYDDIPRSYGVELHYLTNDYTKGKLKLYREGVARIREIKPDLIHTHTRFSDLLGLYGGKQAGVKTRMMTVHSSGMYFLDSKPFHEGVIEYFVVRFAHHFAVISKGVGEYLRRAGNISPEKITLIYNGIDPDRVSPPVVNNKEEVRAKLNIDNNEFLITTVGRLIPEKGFDLLLDEFKTFREKTGSGKLLLIGRGPEDLALKSKAGTISISDHVIFFGESGNLADFFRASDCFVLSSRKEGFGIVLLEAMANSLPVIASNVGGIPEIVTHRENGLLFNVREKGSCVSMIEKLFQDRELGTGLAASGYNTAMDKFHVKLTAFKYEELYHKLLGTA